MSGSTDELLHALANSDQRDTPRRNINLLFAACDSIQMDQLLTTLRTARFSPRGQSVQSSDELLNVLSQRSWDLLIFAWRDHYSTELTPTSALDLLNRLNRDIPVILLTPGQQYQDPTHWLGIGVEAVLPERNHERLLLELGRQYNQLQTRRQLRDAQSRLAQLQQRCQQLIETSPQAICLLHNGLIQYANRSFARLFGYDGAEHLLEHSLRQLLEERFRDDLDLILRECDHSSCSVQRNLTAVRPDDTRFEARFSFAPVEYEGNTCLEVEVVTDLDDSDELFRDSHPISGLSNQHAFMQALEIARSNARRGGQDRNLMLLTLDHLEVIRGEVGSDGVDLILRDIARILKQKVSRAHLLAHLDDNSFAIILHSPDPNKAVEIGEQLCHAVSSHICQVQNTSIHTTLSVGVVVINDSAPTCSELLAHARMAADSLHHGNRPGNGVSLYQEEKALLSSSDAKISKRLQNALRMGRFRLLYQPVVPLRLETADQYYEVLLRLMSDSDKEISPNAFIAQAIEPEVLIELDRWVIGQALLQLQNKENIQKRTHLLINLSGASLRSTELVQWLAEELRQSHVAAELLVFEISESDAAVNLMEARNFAHAMQQLHCKVCLKHFGSSPNSEHVRQELDAEFIKLDGSYIQDLQNRNLSLESLQEILNPLQQQNKLIIAPLVEKTRVISDLFSAGVHLIQGHYLQPPREKMDYDFFDS
jgi:diguanylate cyclase (GGDEF)-like protein/PAS domain S-box-containing protein